MTDAKTALDVVHQKGPFQFTTTGMRVVREPKFAEWSAALGWAYRVDDAVQFWIGDLIEFGQAKYGEKYSQALRSTGYAEQSAKNITYTSRKVSPERRRSEVPFSHHVEVAALPPVDQERWLARCADDHMTRDELRAAIRDERRSASTSMTPGDTGVNLWLVVSCKNIHDQQQLSLRMQSEGRSTKIVSRPVKGSTDPASGLDDIDI